MVCNTGKLGNRFINDIASTVDFRNRILTQINDLIGKLLCAAGCGADQPANGIQAGGDCRTFSVGVVGSAVDHLLQSIQFCFQLSNIINRQIKGNMRLHLTGNAANLFAPIHSAVVFAVGKMSAASANDTSHIVADMGVANYRIVLTSEDHAGRIPGNTAGVTGNIYRVQDRDYTELCGEKIIQFTEADGGIEEDGIDQTFVGAL